MRGEWWSVPREWSGETVFIIGGGTSVASQNLELLRDRHVVAVNSSYEIAPFADYLITHDPQWWREHEARVQFFKGKIVQPTEFRKYCKRRLFVHKRYPPGPSVDPSYLAMKRTTFSAAINFAMLQGAARIVLLGADGRMGKDGRSHHHTPHRWWKFRADRWDLHLAELKTFVEPLRKLGVEVINASPGTAWTDLWPVMALEDAIEKTECRRAA